MIATALRRATLALLGVLLASPLAGSEVARRLHRFPLGEGAPVHIEAPRGQLRLEAHDGPDVEVELVLRCTGAQARCEQAAREVAVTTSLDDERPVARIAGPARWEQGVVGERPVALVPEGAVPEVLRTCRAGPGARARAVGREAPGRRSREPGWRLEVELRVLYPRGRRLEIRLDEGDLQVADLEADAQVRVGDGTVFLGLGEARAGALQLAAGKGDAQILPRTGRPIGGRRTLLGGAKVAWTGSGGVDVSAEVVRGCVLVQLR